MWKHKPKHLIKTPNRENILEKVKLLEIYKILKIHNGSTRINRV